MPCTYDDFGESEREKDKSLDKLTRMLCSVLGTLEESYKGKRIPFELDREVVSWWVKHKRMDEERRLAEKAEQDDRKLVADALKKLTTKERKALGLC